MSAVDLVRALRIPRIQVRTLDTGELCIMPQRDSRIGLSAGSSQPACAAVVLDGTPSDTRQLEGIPGETVGAIAYLRPSEAGARFGTGTTAGALVVWTRRGGR